MRKPSLVIMAAGMGSRYGGLKQIESIDSYGHTLIDYSIYDAIEAGFREITFVIKKEIDADFRSVMEPHLRGKDVKVNYVYQELHKLPSGYSIPSGRVKPWGTAHAVLCCKDVIDAPFAVINADDYYGKSAFRDMYAFLSSLPEDSDHSYAMIGYRIKNTVSPSGTVSRGICHQDEEGMLTHIVERSKIMPEGDKIYFYEGDEKEELHPDSLVSMNFWGFDPSFILECESRFKTFLDDAVVNDPLKGEFYLPKVVASLISEGAASVKVMESRDRWYGVTHREDHDSVAEAFSKMIENGEYPGDF